MEAVLTALLLSGSVPLLHICILRLIRKSDMAIRIMFLCFLLYASLWYIGCLIQNDFETPSATAWIGGVSSIVLVCLGYMEAFWDKVDGKGFLGYIYGGFIGRG